eukprot:5457650-Amphidinium_carterae.1
MKPVLNNLGLKSANAQNGPYNNVTATQSRYRHPLAWATAIMHTTLGETQRKASRGVGARLGRHFPSC